MLHIYIYIPHYVLIGEKCVTCIPPAASDDCIFAEEGTTTHSNQFSTKNRYGMFNLLIVLMQSLHVL